MESYHKKNKEKETEGKRQKETENSPKDYSHVITDLQTIVRTINKQNLPESESLLCERITALTNDYAGVCNAYCLLNDYFIEQQLDATSSAFDDDTLKALRNIYDIFLENSQFNWFGVPNIPKLIDANLYGGEWQYGQRMQHMIAHLAKHVSNIRAQIQPQLKKLYKEIGPLDEKFLADYVNGKLSSEKIQALDKLTDLLGQHSADFVTIQTALHLYRFIIVAKSTNFKYLNDDEVSFIIPRTLGMPLKQLHPELDYQALIDRIEFLLPDGELKDFYLRSDLKDGMTKKGLQELFTQYYENDKRSGDYRTASTPLRSTNYCSHMKNILAMMHIDEISIDPKSGLLPYYEIDNEGCLKETEFGTVYFGQIPWVKEAKQGGEITNSSIDAMVAGVNEKWPGEVIYKHLSRLYVISLLTNNPGVAEEARRRLEWWYSNVMPYERGSAAVSESASKTLQLSHSIVPTKMLGVLPDLFAICQHGEQGYVDRYHEVYPVPQYRVTKLARRSEPSTRPKPSTPLPTLDNTDQFFSPKPKQSTGNSSKLSELFLGKKPK